MVGQDCEVGGEAMPVCRQNLAVDQTALEYHGLQQESWWALGGPQPLIFTILAPSLAGKMGKGLSASPVRLTLIEPSHAPSPLLANAFPKLPC